MAPFTCIAQKSKEGRRAGEKGDLGCRTGAASSSVAGNFAMLYAWGKGANLPNITMSTQPYSLKLSHACFTSTSCTASPQLQPVGQFACNYQYLSASCNRALLYNVLAGAPSSSIGCERLKCMHVPKTFEGDRLKKYVPKSLLAWVTVPLIGPRLQNRRLMQLMQPEKGSDPNSDPTTMTGAHTPPP